MWQGVLVEELVSVCVCVCLRVCVCVCTCTLAVSPTHCMRPHQLYRITVFTKTKEQLRMLPAEESHTYKHTSGTLTLGSWGWIDGGGGGLTHR